MTLQLSEKMMRRAVPYFTTVTVLAVLCLCMTSMAYSATPNVALATKTYSVTLTASPKSQTVAPGATATVTVTEKNTGSSSFSVTGCVIEGATSKGGPYTNLGCTLSAPYTIAAHSTAKATVSVGFTTTASGMYYFKFYNTGKVGATSEKTKTATYTVTVS
jgi:hypothetical protein